MLALRLHQILNMSIKYFILPATLLVFLDTFTGSCGFLVPNLDNTARSVDALEDTRARLCHADSGVQVRIFFRHKARCYGPDKSPKILWTGNSGGPESLSSIQDFAIAGVN